MSTMRHDVVVIPTYNERKNITTLIPALFSAVPWISVLVVDDNSPDGTALAVRLLQQQFPRLRLLSRQGKEGLGRAYIHAFGVVLTDLTVTSITMMDADHSHDPKYLPAMFAALDRGAGVVVGSRHMRGGATVGWELWRRILSWGGNLYCRIITWLPIHDCTGGFNIMRAELLRKVDFSQFDVSGYAFIMELKYALWRSGATFVEVPIVFRNRVEGESKISRHIIGEGVIAPWKMRHKGDSLVLRATPRCSLCATPAKFFSSKWNFDLYRCPRCRFLFVHPLPADIASVYDKNYFTGGEGGVGYTDYDRDKAPMAVSFARYCGIIERLHCEKGRLLDVGAATGFFLDIARARGWDVSGVEVSSYAASVARGKGHNVQTGTFSSATILPASLDAITMFDVLEHFIDPLRELATAARLLKPGGLLAINTPNASSLSARIFGRHWHLIIPPEHLHYFSPDNLSRYLRQLGFRVVYSGGIWKSFTFYYIFQTFYRSQGFRIWRILAALFRGGWRERLAIPLPPIDSFFLIAEKL